MAPAEMRRSLTAPAAAVSARKRRAHSDAAASAAKLPAELSILDQLNLDLPHSLSRSFETLCHFLLSEVSAVEQDLKALESEDDDSSDDENDGLTMAMDGRKQESALLDFVSHAREYIDHVKAELPSIGLPSFAHMPELREMLSSTTASVPSVPRGRQEVSHFIERISKKLERVHETLTALVSASTTVASPSTATTGPPLPSPAATLQAEGLSTTTATPLPVRPGFQRRYTIAALYAHVPAVPTPFPAIHAFLSHESQRLSQTNLLRRPSFARLNTDFEEMMGKAKHQLELVADGAMHGLESFADEAKRELHVLRDEADRVAHALREGATRLLHYNELPEAWKNNSYIHSGYRFIPIERWGALLASAFQWHNETFNIWSHALGAASLIYGIICLHPTTPQAQSAYAADGAVTLMFLLAAVACMLCSAIWHTMSGCGTCYIFNGCACLDYVGISALISGSVVTMVYYGFYCEPDLALRYITFCLACGISGVFLPWQTWFNERRNKPWRIAFFLSLCASAIVPQTHMALKYGVFETVSFYSPVLLSVTAYVAGLVLYATNFPERLAPGGIFDTIAHSHQFWHCAIILAVYLHWMATTHMYRQGTEGFSCAVR